jgi:uncharacterized protein (UPF0261 family)
LSEEVENILHPESYEKSKIIVITGTLDTKGDIVLFLKDRIERRGHKTIVVDTGVLGNPFFAPDISRDTVAESAGTSIKELATANDRGKAISAISEGTIRVVQKLYYDGKLDGIISVGGGQGTIIATTAMRALPVGIPKLMVSTKGSSNIRPYVGTKDITMMHSVVDIAGLPQMLRNILINAAGAICGMVEEAKEPYLPSDKTMIGITMFGVTTPCVMNVKFMLEERGYEVLIFHAVGTGGMAMEELIDNGTIGGVIDITTTELADELCGGAYSAGTNRLEAAGRKGIPQVVVPGALDMVNFAGKETIPERFSQRLFYQYNPLTTLMRTDPRENAILGRIVAQKMNLAKGPTIIAIPLLGFSAYDIKGEIFYDPEADLAFLNALKEYLDSKIKVVEVNAHINDPIFAESLFSLFCEIGL